MSKKMSIEIDLEVHKRIEQDRRSFDESPNDILRRILLPHLKPTRRTQAAGLAGAVLELTRQGSFHSAVTKVLMEAEKPLHYEEITRRILEKGLVRTRGDTPEKTVSATLTTDMRSSNATFARFAPGVYGLLEWKKNR